MDDIPPLIQNGQPINDSNDKANILTSTSNRKQN